MTNVIQSKKYKCYKGVKDVITLPNYQIYNNYDVDELFDFASDWVINQEDGYDLLVPILPGTGTISSDIGRPTITSQQFNDMWINVGTNLFDLGGYNKIQVYTQLPYENSFSFNAYSYGHTVPSNLENNSVLDKVYFGWHGINAGNQYSEVRLINNEFCPKIFGIQNFSGFNRYINDWNFDVFDEKLQEWVTISHNQDSAPSSFEISKYVLNNTTYYTKMRIRLSSSGGWGGNYLNVSRLRVWGYYKKKIKWFMLQEKDGYLIED